LDQEEVYSQYRNSDIFVLPSIKGRNGWIESQGIVIQEAQLHGLAVVGSSIGGIPEGLNYGKAGLLFKTASETDLALQLQRLLDNPVFARNIATEGMLYCKTKYSKGVAMESIEVLYKSLIDGSFP
jgi:glycosyltransferase involved in cell wall biosynthesis